MEILAKYDVVSLPTVLLMMNDTVWGRSVGVKTEAEYRTWLDTHLAIEAGLSEEGATFA